MKNLFKFFLIAGILNTYSCNDKAERTTFDFYNNSNEDVYIYLGTVPRNVGGCLYPDTALMDSNVTFGPIKRNTFYGKDFYREFTINTFSLFILSADTINKYNWSEIKSGYKILQRYDLNVTDAGLRKLNFDIIYPPSEAMKDVRMYPPYKEK